MALEGSPGSWNGSSLSSGGACLVFMRHLLELSLGMKEAVGSTSFTSKPSPTCPNIPRFQANVPDFIQHFREAASTGGNPRVRKASVQIQSLQRIELNQRLDQILGVLAWPPCSARVVRISGGVLLMEQLRSQGHLGSTLMPHGLHLRPAGN